MKAAYKWRIENGLYGYLTDETGNGNPFVYDIAKKTRMYSDGTIVVGSQVNDSAISTSVSRMPKADYISAFDNFKTFINARYPQVSLLDAIYYYNIENDECSASASSLKCSGLNIVFDATATTGDTANAEVINMPPDPDDEDVLRYRVDFTIPTGPQGAPGPTPDINVKDVVTTTLGPNEQAHVNITKDQTSTTNNAKFNFEFQIPRGQGVDGNGNLTSNTIFSTTIISNTVTANTISANTAIIKAITANTISATTVISKAITANTISANTAIINTITANTISSNTITTNKIETKEIKDKLFLVTADSTGWWTIYKVPRESSSVRMHIAQAVSCEEFYVEVNTGYWNSTATGNIAILNGYNPWSSGRITKIRIVNDVNGDQINHLADIQIYIAELYNGSLDLRFNNVEGPGEFVFEKESRENPPRNYEFDLSNGMKAEKFVKNGGTSSQYLMADGSVSTGQTFTDTKVAQQVVGSNYINYRPLLFGDYSSPPSATPSFSNTTGITYATNNIYASPSSGTIYVNNVIITGSETGNVSVIDMMPTGSIIMWPTSGIPNGWLLCDGKAIRVAGSPGNYSAYTAYGENWSKFNKLVTILQYTYGYGYGSWSNISWVDGYPSHTTTSPDSCVYINVPNLTLRFPFGATSDGKLIGYNNIFKLTLIKKDILVTVREVWAYDNNTISVGAILDLNNIINVVSGKNGYYKITGYTSPTVSGTSRKYTNIKVKKCTQYGIISDDTEIQIFDLFNIGTTNFYYIEKYSTKCGNKGGEDVHKLTVDEIPSHNHNISFRTYGVGGSEHYFTGAATAQDDDFGYEDVAKIDTKGGSQSHNNMPPFLAVNFIIKYA